MAYDPFDPYSQPDEQPEQPQTPPSPPPDPHAASRGEITGLYQQYLGRDPTEQDIATHTANPGGAPGYRSAISQSDEARAYANRPPPQPGTATGTGISPTTFNYERARDSWMSGQYGGGEAGARAWAAANGVPYGGGDTIRLPNGGGDIDIIGNFASGRNMANNWTPAGGNGPNPGGQGFGGFGGNTGIAGGIGGGSSQGSYGITGNAIQDQYRASLLNLMQQGERPVDEESLGIRQPYQAASLAAQRQLEQQRAVDAERAYALGEAPNSGYLANLGRQGAERAAVGLAGVKAGLVGNEIGARRQQLHQALQLANSIGARSEAQQLQRELAQMENQYRYSALGQQASQFGENMGLNMAQLQSQRERDAMLSLLGR